MSGFSGGRRLGFWPCRVLSLFWASVRGYGRGQRYLQFQECHCKNRHSVLDITDGEDEPDPLDPRFRGLGSREDLPAGTRDDSQAGTRAVRGVVCQNHARVHRVV